MQQQQQQQKSLLSLPFFQSESFLAKLGVGGWILRRGGASDRAKEDKRIYFSGGKEG